MLVIDDLTRPAPEVETPFTFPLDPFQKYACAAIAAEENVLVTAKTGSGKTLVGEFQIHYSLGKGKRVFYVNPKIAHRILDLAMPEKDLDGAKVAGCPVDDRCLRSPK